MTHAIKRLLLVVVGMVVTYAVSQAAMCAVGWLP